MNIKGFISNVFSGVTGGRGISKSTPGKMDKKEGLPQLSLHDNVTLSSKPEIPYKTVTKESKNNLVQNTGVFQETKVVNEEIQPDLAKVKPGTSFENKGTVTKRIKEEVKLKSGIVISSEPQGSQVKISQNTPDGNLKCMAVLDNTSLGLPSDNKDPFAQAITSLWNGPNVKSDDLVIQNSQMKQVISPNGTITLIDERRGVLEPRFKPGMAGSNNSIPGLSMFSGIPVPGAGIIGAAMGITSKWNGDTYTITPDGKVTGTQYMRNKMQVGDKTVEIPQTCEKIQVKGEQLSDGTIKVNRGGKDIYYKPFISSKFVNSGAGE